MSKRAEQGSREPARSRIAGVVFSILPATMILGLLAPGFVETQLVAAQSAVVPEAPERVAWRPRHFKTPLLVPSEILVDRGIELADVSGLLERFAEVVGIDHAGKEEVSFAELPTFQSREDDSIVIDDVDDYVAQEIFETPLEPGLKADLSPAWPLWAESDIPYDLVTLGAGDGFTFFDDFVGEELPLNAPPNTESVPEVPEPGTAALLGLGLVALALRRRARP